MENDLKKEFSAIFLIWLLITGKNGVFVEPMRLRLLTVLRLRRTGRMVDIFREIWDVSAVETVRNVLRNNISNKRRGSNCVVDA